MKGSYGFVFVIKLLVFTHDYFLGADSAGLAFVSAGVWTKNGLVGANYPIWWQTMSSEIVIGINFLPL